MPHNGLRLLADQVGGGLVYDLHAATPLHADAVAPPLPAGLLEQLGGLIEIELPAGVGRLKRLRAIEDVAGRLAGSAVELLGDGATINGQRKGLPYPEVGEKGMGHLHTAALAIDFGPGVRAIELNVLDECARCDVKPALAPLLPQPFHDILIHLNVPGEVELPGLEHGPGGGGGVPATLQLHRVKEGAVGHVIVWVDGIQRHIPLRKVDELVWSGAHWLQIIRRVAGSGPGVGGKEVLRQNHLAPGRVPEGGRLCKYYRDRMVVEFVDAADRFIIAAGSEEHTS